MIKLPKELLKKKKKITSNYKTKSTDLFSKDATTQSRKKPQDYSIKDIINWMKKYNPKDILTWIEVISIHPSNQIFQVRFEFLIAILLSIELNEFQNKVLRYNELKKFIQDFQKKSDKLFIEDYTPYYQLKLIPYFFQNQKFFFFYGLTGRIYEILKKLERIYIFQDSPDYPEFKLFKTFFIQVLNFQTKILNKLKQLQESKKQTDQIYVPTINFYRDLEPLLKIKPESISDKRYISKFGRTIENFNDFRQNIFNGNYFKRIYIQVSKDEFFLILPQTQIETLFSIFKNIVLASPNRSEIERYIDANILRNLTFACGEFFTRRRLVLNIFDLKKNLITQNIDVITLYDNYLFLFKIVNAFGDNNLSKEINKAYKILDDTSNKLKSEEEILLDNGSSFFYKTSFSELIIFKFVIYESIDLSVSLTDLQIEKNPENQLFNMMDIIVMFEMLTSELSFIKYIREREKYFSKILTINGINLLGLFLQNNESLPDYGEVMIMIDPHLWTDYYNKFLFEKFQDNIYELIEIEAPHRFNKIIKWEESQNLYECFNTFNLYGACIIKLVDELIWVYYPEPNPILNLEDLRYIMRLFGPLYADYIQRLLTTFQEIFSTYQFNGKFGLFLCPKKICENNPKFSNYQEIFIKISEDCPLIVYSFINSKKNLISLIFYNAEYWVKKFYDSTINDGPQFAMEQLLYSIIKLFEPQIQDNEVREKVKTIIVNDFLQGPNDYCITPIRVKNPKLRYYPPYLKINQTDQESVVKEIENYLREKQIEKGSLSPVESKALYNDLYREFYKKFEEMITKYDSTLLYFAYQQLELIEGNRYQLLIETGMRSQNLLEEKYIEFFRKKQAEISNLSSSTRFILENVLKFGINGKNKINVEKWSYLQSLSLYLLLISQRSEFTHTEIMPFTIEIKEYHKFDEIQNPAIFNYNDFMEAEFKRKLETAQVVYDTVKEKSKRISVKNEDLNPFISLINNLDISFRNQFSFSFTNMMRILYLLSTVQLYSQEYFPLTIILEDKLKDVLKFTYKEAYIDQINQNDNSIELKDEEISQILKYISLSFNSYGDEPLLLTNLLKSKERLTLCPLIHIEGGEFLFGNECCSTSFNLWKMHILSGVFPYKISEKSEVGIVLQNIHSFMDKDFENECGEIAKQILGNDFVLIRLKNFKRISDSFPKFPDCGEIDFLAINPEIKTIFVFDSKNYYLRLIPYNIKNEIHKFIERKKSEIIKIRKKADFVSINLEEFLNFFKITDISGWKLKKGFIIRKNFPTKYLPNIDADFVFINELESYLQGIIKA